MNAPVRYGLTVLLLGGLGGFGYLLGHDPAAAEHGAQVTRFTSSIQCRDCHQEVFAEWQGSHHQIAYQNPEVRKLSDDFRNKECQACHLPRPISETGLLNRTLPRVTRPDEGVDCLSCHLGANGRVIGVNASDAGCAPVADPEFMSVKLCETCHNQHQTTDQWRASPFAAEGVDCNDCHMPVVTRAGGKPGRAHVYLGAHDLDTLKSAAVFDLVRDGDRVVVSVTNERAGHNFPTEERHRAVDILVRFVDDAGEASDWQQVFRFRQPYRDEPGENTQLPSGRTHRSEVQLPAGTKRVEARLWYRLNPFATNDDPASSLLFEQALEIE